jgi:hypothetical protein
LRKTLIPTTDIRPFVNRKRRTIDVRRLNFLQSVYLGPQQPTLTCVRHDGIKCLDQIRLIGKEAQQWINVAKALEEGINGFKREIARIVVPVQPVKPDAATLDVIWADLDRLASEIGRKWPIKVTAAEAVSAARR